MTRNSVFCLACFLALVFFVLAFAFSANAAPAKERATAEVTEKKLAFDTGKKDKHGKAVRREFPVMFDIVYKAKKHKEKKASKKK